MLEVVSSGAWLQVWHWFSSFVAVGIRWWVGWRILKSAQNVRFECPWPRTVGARDWGCVSKGHQYVNVTTENHRNEILKIIRFTLPGRYCLAKSARQGYKTDDGTESILLVLCNCNTATYTRGTIWMLCDVCKKKRPLYAFEVTNPSKRNKFRAGKRW